MATRNILFYSEICPLSRKIINMLNYEKLADFFILFCVDGRLHEVPSGLTRVPTMVVNGVDKPLVANDIMGWINAMKFMKQKKVDQLTKDKNRLPGYRDIEMNGISDSFAYTNKDTHLPQRYFDIGAEDKNIIFTAPEFDKLNKTYQKKLINQKSKERAEQDQSFSEYNKEQRLEAIKNYRNTS